MAAVTVAGLAEHLVVSGGGARKQLYTALASKLRVLLAEHLAWVEAAIAMFSHAASATVRHLTPSQPAPHAHLPALTPALLQDALDLMALEEQQKELQNQVTRLEAQQAEVRGGGDCRS
jgi:hypothetical protein